VITELKSEWVYSLFLFQECYCLVTLTSHYKLQILIVQSSASCINPTALTIAITFWALIGGCIDFVKFQRLYHWSFNTNHSFTSLLLLLAYKPLKTLLDLTLIMLPFPDLFELIGATLIYRKVKVYDASSPAASGRCSAAVVFIPWYQLFLREQSKRHDWTHHRGEYNQGLRGSLDYRFGGFLSQQRFILRRFDEFSGKRPSI